MVTPVWAPTGLSLASLLLFGYRCWPGVALGAFAANATSDVGVLTAGAIAAGNTLEAVVGTGLLRRGRIGLTLSRARDIVALVAAGGLASTAIAATVGTTALLVADEIAGSGYRSTWFLWWFGDAIGALTVTPLLLTWLAPPRRPFPRAGLGEGLALLIALVAVSIAVFSGDRWQYPYVLFPLLVWAALRFDVRGAATANFAVTAIAVWATVEGSVLIEGATPTETVQTLQALIAIVGVSMLIAAATIRERAEAEEALAASLSLQRATLDATADGVLVVDLEGRIVSFNQRFVDMWRLPPEVVEAGEDDRAVQFVLDQLADPSAFLARVRELYARPEEESTDVLLFRDGRVVERYSRPHRLADRVIGRVWSFRDVTEARRAEVLKGRFLDIAGHEMKNPLGVISGFAGVLIEDWESLERADKLDYLGRIRNQAIRLRELIDSLLLASRAEAGRLQPRVHAVDLVAEVRDALADHHGVEVEAEGAVEAVADPTYVRNMLANYLSNAEKYGAAPVRIEVGARNGDAVVAVCDAGAGVPPELAPALFERFTPTRAALNPQAPGSGLGLWIVRELARAQGGDAWYETRAEGPRFCFRLPLVR